MSFAPLSEVRGGLVLIVPQVIKYNLNLWPYFIFAVIINILAIFAVYLFLDFLHERFMNIKFYRKFMERYIEIAKKKGHKLEKRMSGWGYFAMALFVGLPFTGTGAWTTTLIAWLFDFDRKKSFVAISIGVLISAILSLLVILGILNGFFH